MTKRVRNVTVGADPELFVIQEKTGEVVSAEPYIKGTKYEPFNFDKSHRGFCTSLDNVMAEFTIPPVKSSEEMCRAIHHSVDFINGLLPQGFKTVPVASAILDEKYLQTESAKLFGCEPDFNAWLRMPNEPPKTEGNNMRTCGGHVHIGYEEPYIPTSEELVKACDIYLGVPSIIMDEDNRRREMYGKAGCFRMPPHGVEYRVLSNFWLKSNELIRWVYNQLMRVVDFVNEGSVITPEDAVLIQRAINTSDKQIARHLINKYEVRLAA